MCSIRVISLVVFIISSFSNNLAALDNFQTGAAQCLGEIYRLFGRKITAGLIETSSIVAKLMKYHEVVCFPCDSVSVLYLLILVSSLVNLTIHNSLYVFFFQNLFWNTSFWFRYGKSLFEYQETMMTISRQIAAIVYLSISC